MSLALSPSTKVRLSGAALAGIGVLFIKLCVLDPLANAQRGSASVSLYLKPVIAAPLFILLGLLLVVIGWPGAPRAGSFAARFVSGAGRDSRLKPAGYACVMIVVALGLVLYLWVKHELARLGYERGA